MSVPLSFVVAITFMVIPYNRASILPSHTTITNAPIDSGNVTVASTNMTDSVKPVGEDMLEGRSHNWHGKRLFRFACLSSQNGFMSHPEDGNKVIVNFAHMQIFIKNLFSLDFSIIFMLMNLYSLACMYNLTTSTYAASAIPKLGDGITTFSVALPDLPMSTGKRRVS